MKSNQIKSNASKKKKRNREGQSVLRVKQVSHESLVRGRTHLDVCLEVALEAAEDDLPLSWLEAIENVRNASLQVGPAEEDELLIDEVSVGNLLTVVVQEGSGLKGVEPILSVLDTLL